MMTTMVVLRVITDDGGGQGESGGSLAGVIEIVWHDGDDDE